VAVDRTRRFELPGIQDLNKDQDEALALPLEGQHLIIGGPGTGKSVMALLRARRLAADVGQGRYRFLTYNRLLDQSSRHLFGDDLLTASTLLQWFWKVWTVQARVPMLPPKSGKNFREIDWPAVERFLDNRSAWAPLTERYRTPLPFLLIDEGQDMPKAFYRTLAELGFEHIYVVADQNQHLHPERCSTRQDIQDKLGLDPAEVLELRINYRNTRPIALLADHFYPGDPASPRPEIPAAKPGAGTPELWCYGSGETLSLDDVASRILQMADRDPRKLIGVIAPTNDVRTKFLHAIECARPPLDNGQPPLQTYESGSADHLDFGQGGIMVINANASKGLEFDVAILADIDAHQPRNNEDALKKRFYVMVTRAREQAILLRSGVANPLLDRLLPDNAAVLMRRDADAEVVDDALPF
jgi:DNA helicase-2/ATP-dependent DNA helicase PcrA